ncbi:MAG: response regulator transcription factor [Clostridia bacterium]|nr:response regulator transcription factor [Clostridia bacterium]
MIRIAICDDEKKILDEVSGYIKNYAEKKSKEIEVFRFDSAALLIGALEDGKSFDIFVLDVYIGDERGTVLARDIRKLGIESPIIFATTSVEHAPESYETGTLRYLIKPINLAKFYEAMDAALASVEKISQRLIKMKTENGLESINVSHIICSEVHDHYQYVTMYNGTQIKIRMTVTELFTMLSGYGGFIRIGSAYIINLRHVKNVSRTEVCLYNDVMIQIPRGKHEQIKNAFWNFQYEGQE